LVPARVSNIGFPVNGSHVSSGSSVTVSGTAAEAAGVVGGVEVSTDGGATWAAATGGAHWTFAWTPGAPGVVNLRSRAVDDLGHASSRHERPDRRRDGELPLPDLVAGRRGRPGRIRRAGDRERRPLPRR